MAKTISKKTHATNFEKRIKKFLEKFEFEDVEGARDDFEIGGIQLDVCGGHEDSLLVVECTMSTELRRKTLRNKIKEFRGSATSWERGFKTHPEYKKYKKFIYLLATKNIDVRREDIDFANSDKPKIYILDEDFFDYYEDLFGKINKYAKYNLLGELRIRPKPSNNISVPAFKIKQDKVVMYSFCMDPKDLLEVSYVARRNSKHERFYQRMIKKDRLNSLSKYIEQGNVLPNNLIIAFGDFIRKYAHFSEIKKDYIGECTAGIGIHYGILEFPRDYRSCWIIDGQHRLFAFVHTGKNMLVPVIAFENIDLEKQSKIFLDINKNQKPVPADLVWDLNGDMIPSEEDGMISNVVKILNNEKGPLQYKIKIPSKGLRKGNMPSIKLAGMCLSIRKSKLVCEITQSRASSPFFFLTSNKIPNSEKVVNSLSRSLNDYFYVVKDLFQVDWELQRKGFILDDGGMSVMLRLFEKIVSYFVLESRKKIIPSEEEYRKYLKPVAKLFEKNYSNIEDLKVLKRELSSEAGKEAVLKRFLLNIKNETGENIVPHELVDLKSQQLRKLERKLKELIKDVLEEHYRNDWYKEIPPQIWGKAKKNQLKHNEEDINKTHLHFIFGECLHIMRENKKLFYALFKNESGFGSDIEIEGAFNTLSRIKSTQMSHDVGISMKKNDNELFRIYIDKINSCIDDYYL